MVVELKLILRIDLHVICDMNGATLGKDRFPGVGIDALNMKILLPSGDLDVLNETSVSLRARVAGLKGGYPELQWSRSAWHLHLHMEDVFARSWNRNDVGDSLLRCGVSKRKAEKYSHYAEQKPISYRAHFAPPVATPVA
jgi:hypothetical protein